MYRTPSGVFCVILETEYEKEEYYEPRYLVGNYSAETRFVETPVCSANLPKSQWVAGTISAL